jgi:hypothetical protein
VTGSARIHFVRVYDFRFFFKVKCLTLLQHNRVFEFVLKFFLVT